MLVKIENGFYLNAHHIIAVRVARSEAKGQFIVNIEYTPNSMQKVGVYEITFETKIDAEKYLQTLSQALPK